MRNTLMLFSSAAHRLADSLEADWRARARPNQLMPAGAWTVWLLMAGIYHQAELAEMAT
jgi:phage terminase large subunit-like protein